MARSLRINADSVVLPDGNLYQSGDETVITNEQYYKIVPSLIANDASTLITDLGEVGIVMDQGPAVTVDAGTPPAATATVEDDDNTEILADVQAIREVLSDVVDDVGELQVALTGANRALSP